MVSMKTILIVAFVSTIQVSLFAQNPDDQCFNCHNALEDNASKLFQTDIHYKKGITCAHCHGGNSHTDDMEIAMSKKSGYIGIPKGDVKSLICEKCHDSETRMRSFKSNLKIGQFKQLKESVHGKISITGKENIIQCVNCHDVHRILPAKDLSSSVNPLNIVNKCSKCHSSALYMRNYNPGLAVDQREKYRTSTHGIRNSKGDAKVAECASCHGNHNILSAKDVRSSVYITNIPKTCSKCHADEEYMKEYNLPVNQYQQFVNSVHGKSLLEKKDSGAPSCNSCHGNHGAIPPGVESISQICGTCHALNAELFNSSPHKKIFDEKLLPECETCHGNHKIEVATNKLLGVDKDAVCSKCHKENENEKGYKSAKLMKQLLDTLEIKIQLANKLIAEADNKGMEISDAKFKLRDVNQAKQEARTMIHSFNEGNFKEIIYDKGLAGVSSVIEQANVAVDNFYFRRYGLVIFIIIVSYLSVVLFLYIKRLDKKNINKQI